MKSPDFVSQRLSLALVSGKELEQILSLHDLIDSFEIGTEHAPNPQARATFLAAGPWQTKLVFGKQRINRNVSTCSNPRIIVVSYTCSITVEISPLHSLSLDPLAGGKLVTTQ